MDHPELNRRDFNRLTMAAFGGVLAGTAAGCGEDKKPAPPGPNAGTGKFQSSKADGKDVASTKGEPHACRGLNACKGQGEGGSNDCAGQGDCATKEWHHSCGGENACKGQGGCGPDATQNDCKTKGGCHVPLMDSAWESARKHFEQKMESAEKKFGDAPPKKKKS